MEYVHVYCACNINAADSMSSDTRVAAAIPLRACRTRLHRAYCLRAASEAVVAMAHPRPTSPHRCNFGLPCLPPPFTCVPASARDRAAPRSSSEAPSVRVVRPLRDARAYIPRRTLYSRPNAALSETPRKQSHCMIRLNPECLRNCTVRKIRRIPILRLSPTQVSDHIKESREFSAVPHATQIPEGIIQKQLEVAIRLSSSFDSLVIIEGYM